MRTFRIFSKLFLTLVREITALILYTHDNHRKRSGEREIVKGKNIF